MMSAFLPGPLKKGSAGFRLPTRTAGGSVRLFAWQIRSFSLETQKKRDAGSADATRGGPAERGTRGAAARAWGGLIAAPATPFSSTHLTSSP